MDQYINKHIHQYLSNIGGSEVQSLCPPFYTHSQFTITSQANTTISLSVIRLISCEKYFIKNSFWMGVTIRKYFQLQKFQIRTREASTVHIYPGLENGWTGYKQLAGSQQTSTKRTEIEVLTCVAAWVAIMCTKIPVARQQLLESFDTL